MIVTDQVGCLSSRALLEELTCPYCGGALVSTMSCGHPSREYGIVACDCGDSPVVDGIIWLSRRQWGLAPQDDPVIGRVLDRVRAGDQRGALCEALLSSFRDRYRQAATAMERFSRRPPDWLLNQARQRLTREVLLDQDLSFARAASLLRNGPYARYLHHRFANPSLLAAIPVILMLKELADRRPARVLEVAGGCGHASFLINRFFPEIQMVLTDGDFVNLYLARRFIAPDAVCVCLDAEARMPFQPSSFDAVFCMDAFHYVREKIGLVEELRRTLRPDGLWLFPHLHNASAKNPTAGYPLPARGYKFAFSGVEARLFPEEALLRSFHERMALDLTQGALTNSSSQAPAFTLIGGPESLWREHNLSSHYQKVISDLNFNTIYDFSPAGVGSLRWPSAELRRECQLAEEFLDPEPLVDPGLISRLRSESLSDCDLDDVRFLQRNFVLVPMPPGYR